MNILFDLFLTFAKIGVFTFGGGYAMISLLDHECVEKKEWLSSDELMDITVVAESTPGPIAINCATYTGYKKAGLLGAIIATFGIILPSFLIILVVSTFFDNLLTYPIVANAFRGIRVAVALIIIEAAIKMISKMLKKAKDKTISIGFVVVFFLIAIALNLAEVRFPTIYLIIVAGLVGFCIFSRKGGIQK